MWRFVDIFYFLQSIWRFLFLEITLKFFWQLCKSFLVLMIFSFKDREIYLLLTKKIKIKIQFQFSIFFFCLFFYGVQLFSVIFLSWCGAGLLSSPLEDEDRWSKFFELDSTIWWWLLWSPRVFIKTLRAALHWLKAPQNILNICFSCSRASCRHCSKEKIIIL